MNKEKIESIIKEVSPRVLVAATKYIDVDNAKELLNYGINNFGENRTNSFLLKYNALSNENIIWHFIGHLQKNKVKDVINKIDYLHSLDSISLIEKIEKYRDKPLKTFIELHLTDSVTKNGVRVEELDDFIKEVRKHKIIDLIGFMVMADSDMSDREIEEVFTKANELKIKYNLKELSMGMSDDYKIALKCNTTFVRLGRILYSD